MKPNSILLVEDNANFGDLLKELLETECYQVELCRTGLDGLNAFQKNTFSLCILDVMLPQIDGFRLAELIRQQDKNVPFLFLTARSMKEDRLKGYSLGAEDYLSKPFDEEELLCKINVILRRQYEASNALIPTQFTIGSYSYDYAMQELTFEGKIKRITEKENEVLRLLCLNKNRILKREEAVEKIYGKRDYFLGRSFDVFISRVRKLLKDDASISIENVFGVGFILREN